MQRIWVALGSVAGCGAVAMAAYAAHGLGGEDSAARRVVESGVQMQGWHALALVGTGLWAARGGWLTDLAGAAFAIGIVMFCGALYALGIEGRSLGAVAPVGGTLLMLGWLLLAASAVFPQRRGVS